MPTLSAPSIAVAYLSTGGWLRGRAALPWDALVCTEVGIFGPACSSFDSIPPTTAGGGGIGARFIALPAQELPSRVCPGFNPPAPFNGVENRRTSTTPWHPPAKRQKTSWIAASLSFIVGGVCRSQWCQTVHGRKGGVLAVRPPRILHFHARPLV